MMTIATTNIYLNYQFLEDVFLDFLQLAALHCRVLARCLQLLLKPLNILCSHSREAKEHLNMQNKVRLRKGRLLGRVRNKGRVADLGLFYIPL